MDSTTHNIIQKLREEIAAEEMSQSQRIKLELLDELQRRLINGRKSECECGGQGCSWCEKE